MKVKIELNANEMLVAGYVGMRRNAEAKYNKRKVRFPERKYGELWGNHIESAMAECAVCKYLGVYWGFGVNTFHVSDVVNRNYEIRFSNRSDLKVRPDDEGIIISVSGDCPVYFINGFINANEAKRSCWLYDQEPICYFVPHQYLYPINELNDKENRQEPRRAD